MKTMITMMIDTELLTRVDNKIKKGERAAYITKLIKTDIERKS